MDDDKIVGAVMGLAGAVASYAVMESLQNYARAKGGDGIPAPGEGVEALDVMNVVYGSVVPMLPLYSGLFTDAPYYSAVGAFMHVMGLSTPVEWVGLK